MTKPATRSHNSGSDHQEPAAYEAVSSGATLQSATGNGRKPYRRPLVQKRRSVSEATLISAGGVGGSLAGGAP